MTLWGIVPPKCRMPLIDTLTVAEWKSWRAFSKNPPGLRNGNMEDAIKDGYTAKKFTLIEGIVPANEIGAEW